MCLGSCSKRLAEANLSNMQSQGTKVIQKKRLENRYNVWVYRAVLLLSFYLGKYFTTGMTVNTVITHLNMIFGSHYGPLSYSFIIVLRVVFAAMEVLITEIAARLVFMLSNSMSFGAVTMSYKNFVGSVRLFVIAKNLIFGIFGLLFYRYNFLIAMGVIVGDFVIATAVYFMFFLYIKKHYLDPKMVNRAFRVLAIIYFSYKLIPILGGVL